MEWAWPVESEAPGRSTSPAAGPTSQPGIGHYQWDLRTDAWAWSPELFVLHGLPAGTRVTTELLLERKHPEDRDSAVQMIASARRDGGLFSCRHRIRRADTDEVRDVVVVGEVQQDGGGEAVAMCGFFVDVTDVPHTPTGSPQPADDERHAQECEHLQVVRSSAVLAFAGEIDAATRSTFADALADAVSTGGGDVYLDISRVGFLDARAVDIAFDAAEHLSTGGRRLLVLGAPRILRRVMKIMDDPRGDLVVLLAAASLPGSGTRRSVAERKA